MKTETIDSTAGTPIPAASAQDAIFLTVVTTVGVLLAILIGLPLVGVFS